MESVPLGHKTYSLSIDPAKIDHSDPDAHFGYVEDSDGTTLIFVIPSCLVGSLPKSVSVLAEVSGDAFLEIKVTPECCLSAVERVFVHSVDCTEPVCQGKLIPACV